MSTARRPAGIPAGAALLTVLLALTACSDDDDASDGTVASIDQPASISSAPGTTATVPPEDTTDIPIVPGTGDIPIVPGTGDIPIVPATADIPVLPSTPTELPYFISVTVGSDDSVMRVEDVPLGASVTIDIVNPSAPDEFHLQGYELGAGQVLGPGEATSLAFVADRPGDFVLESLTTGVVLLTLRVA
jgi:hypothetical protein